MAFAIEDALKMAISQAGYNSLSCEQHETIINFVRGKDFSPDWGWKISVLRSPSPSV